MSAGATMSTKTRCYCLQADWDTAGWRWGLVVGGWEVGCFSRRFWVTERGRSNVSESVWKEYCSRQVDHEMENGVKGHRAGCGGNTRTCNIITHIFFFPLLPCTWTQFHPPPYFPPVILMMGGSNCALHGRPQGLPLCIWVHSPLKTSRWAPWSEMETPHLVAFRNLSGEGVATKAPPLKFWCWLNIYSICLCQFGVQFSILS